MDDVKKTLKKLLKDENVKLVVERLVSIALLSDEKRKQMLPHLHLIAGEGTGITTIGRFYADLLKEYKVFYPHCGKKDYLELNFPYGAAATEYGQFYQSLREAAETQNTFYGVVLVCLNEWKGKNFESDENFASFVRFVQANKKNARFVFQTCTDETFSTRIGDYLKKQFDVQTMVLRSPDEKQALEYVLDLLEKKKIGLTMEGSEELSRLIGQMTEKNEWRGYRSLDELGCRLECEHMISTPDRKLDVETIARVSKEFLPVGNVQKENKIGFTV